MPNHVHGIIQIAKHSVDVDGSRLDGANWDVETQNFASLPLKSTPSLQLPQPPSSGTYKNKFGPQSKNLASIIRGFKIGVTKNARLINPNFQWQARYHDHIIRNEKSFCHIFNYITNNPILWKEDKFYGKE